MPCHAIRPVVRDALTHARAACTQQPWRSGASTTGTNARGLQKAHAPSAASLGVARGSADAVESQKVGMGDAKELAV